MLVARPHRHLRILLGAAAGLVGCLVVPTAATALPPDRAYELVSPPAKDGNDVTTDTGTLRSSPSGDVMGFSSLGAFGDSVGAPHYVQYVAARRDGGWTTSSVSPRQDPSPFGGTVGVEFQGFTPNLSTAFLTSPEPPLTPDAPRGVVNLYARDIPDGPFRLLSTTRAPQAPDPIARPELAGSSSDGRRVFFVSNRVLTDGAAPGSNVYESEDGVLSHVASDAVIGAGVRTLTDEAVSRDGRRIYITSPASSGQTFVRDEGSSPVQVSVAEPDAPPGGYSAALPSRFWTATEDGAVALFSTANKLTADSTADQGLFPTLFCLGCRADLYLARVSSTGTADLLDISIDHEPADGVGADLATGGVVRISPDASTVYFVSQNQLVAGGPLDAGPKLYRWSEATGTRFVALLNIADSTVWAHMPRRDEARVSADGQRLLFVSRARLDPDRDNAGHAAAYLYDDGSRQFTCLSCPAGRPATSNAAMFTATVSAMRTEYLPRFLSDDGQRAYLQTGDALLPEDSNGVQDVYLWDRGVLSLVSSGRSDSDSVFADASEDGSSAFFITRERLSGWDRDNNLDVYVARVGGGFPEPPPPIEPCADDGCQGAYQHPLPIPRAQTGSLASSDNPSEPERGSHALRLHRITAKQRRAFARTGRLRLVVTAPRPGRITVTATARLGRGARRKSVARLTINARRAGSNARGVLRLSKAAKRALARRTRLAVTIAARAAGQRRVVRVVLIASTSRTAGRTR